MRKKAIHILILSLSLFWAALANGGPPGRCKPLPGDWTAVYTAEGIEVRSQMVAGLGREAFQAAGTIQAPIDQVLEVLGNIPLAAEWIPDLKRQVLIRKISDLEAIVLSEYRLPFPFANRELLLHSRIGFDPGSKSIVAEAQSVVLEERGVARGNIRAHMYCSRTRLRPAANDCTAVEFTLVAAPGGSIPAFLARFGLKNVPFNFLKALGKKARSTPGTLRPGYRSLLDGFVTLSTSIDDTGTPIDDMSVLSAQDGEIGSRSIPYR